MGTVGLNFGSPTSGAGFDVSSTVATIVSNLQQIETPWKNQLARFQSQDTAISNLETLLSTLSSDVSQLTEFQGVLAQKTGASSDPNVLELTSASTSALAGTHTVVVNSLARTSSGYLAPVASSSQALTGSITLAVGTGTAKTITLNSSDDTLSGLAAAINSSGAGINASVLTDANGSRLSLVSGISGVNGNIVITYNSIAAAESNSLAWTATSGSPAANSSGTLAAVTSTTEPVSGSISIQVGGGSATDVAVPAADPTLAGLVDAINDTSGIGVTASIVTNADGTANLQLTSNTAGSAGMLTVESSVVDSSTALNYTQASTGANASLIVDGVGLSSTSKTATNLIPGLTFQLLSVSPEASDGSSEPVQVTIANDNSGVESAVNQFVADYNALISARHTQEGKTSSGTPEPLFGSPTLSLVQQQLLSALSAANPNGYLDSISSSQGAALSGSITIQVGSNTAHTITLSSSQTSLQDLANAINSAGIGVTAAVVTQDDASTLTLSSQTAGANGALTVTPNITAAAGTQLVGATFTASSTENSGTSFSPIPNADDTLSGSLTIKVGSGTAATVSVPSANSTLAGLADAVNNTNGIGATASIATNADGSESLALTSNTAGGAGNLTVTSSLVDSTQVSSTTALGYTNSSGITNLTSLGVAANNDGSLTLDASALDSMLNSDFSSVVGFFQNANSWGQSSAAMLTNAGQSSSKGILALAANANSTVESQLNSNISREENLISLQQASLTTELNQANQILQALPTQLTGMDELYSAITGYNQKS